MDREPVVSSNLASIGYAAETQTLEIEFTNGSVYQYFDVPQSVYEEFRASGSLGNYLNTVIRKSFRYTRL
jgi:hypothetical protein